ncbi:MAG: hypothetical protein R2799_10540 [Crocinitomicaceae bacterium]
MKKLILACGLIFAAGAFSQTKVYPTDVDSICFIESSEKVLSVTVHNQDGKQMRSSTFGRTSGETGYGIDFRGYPKGRYEITVVTEKGQESFLVNWLMPKAKGKKD